MHNSSCLIIVIEPNAESKPTQAIKGKVSWSFAHFWKSFKAWKFCLFRAMMICKWAEIDGIRSSRRSDFQIAMETISMKLWGHRELKTILICVISWILGACRMASVVLISTLFITFRFGLCSLGKLSDAAKNNIVMNYCSRLHKKRHENFGIIVESNIC